MDDVKEKVEEESDVKRNSKDSAERTGIFTSGVVSTKEGQKIALFFTGRQHAGENLADVLRKRAAELERPIQMCGAPGQAWERRT